MNCFGLFPGCKVDKVERSEAGLVISLRAQRRHAPCSNCDSFSRRVHSTHTRSVRDTAIGEQAVYLHLRVRRFYCLNTNCPQRTFTESLKLFAPHARRTFRLINLQTTVGAFLGGEAGSRLLQKLRMPLCGASLLQSIRTLSTECYPTPRVLGVDDWAVKKGRSYGTILIDLEKHKVVDLLSDRSAAALELWLKASPGVEIIVRDRAYDYVTGANAGAPEAVQVADRWHLLHNLREMFERWLGTVVAKLRQLPISSELQPQVAELRASQYRSSRPTRAAKEAAVTSRERRLGLFNEVKALYASGLPLLTISKKLNIDRKTVRAYAYADGFPERPPRPYTASVLHPYLEYLEKRHAEGCENALQLHREIHELGFRSTAWHVLRWMQPRRREPSKNTPGKRQAKGQREREVLAAAATKLVLPSAPQLSWLALQDEKDLSTENRIILNHLLQDTNFAFMRAHAMALRTMICSRASAPFDAWLDTSESSEIAQLKTFAAGLRRDYAEVRAALELPWSNGQTEGQVNKLKLIKRQMYGRANFDLLRQRVLLAT